MAFFVFTQTSTANTTTCTAQFTFTVNNNTVQFISASSVDSSLINTWYFGDGVSGSSLANPSYTFSSCGTYTVFHQVEQFDNNGNLICQDSTFQVVTIICNTPCSAVASFSAVMVNNQTNVYEFVNSSAVTPNSSILCHWSFGDGINITTQNLSNQVHTYGASGLYNVCLVITSGILGTTNVCSDTFCMSVQAQVNNTPCNLTANFTTANTSSSNTISFVNASTGFAAGDSIRWTFGDGTVSYDLNPTHTFANAGTYNVCLRLVNNTLGAPPCVSENCQQVTILDSTPCNISPSFTYQISPNQSNLYVFTNTSVASTPITMVNWNFGDGTTNTINNPTYLFTTSGTYNVCMQVITSNGCTAFTCSTIVIAPTPQPCNLIAGFTYAPTSAVNTFAFVNASTGFAAGDSIRWTFGDGTVSYDLNPTHTFANAGTYTVCLRLVNNTLGAPPCVSENCQQITVAGTNPCNIIPIFSADTLSPINNYLFTNTTASSSATMFTTWSFGDSTTATGNQVYHVYSQSGIYNVCMHVVINNTCVADTCLTISVTVPNPTPCNVHAMYTSTSVNNQSNVIEFVNSSTTGTTSPTGVYSIWSFGDGSPIVNAPGVGNQVHTFTASGSYTICLKIIVAQPNTGITCVDSICHTIQVQVPNPTPCNLNPIFTVTNDPNDSSIYVFTNTTITNNAPLVTWLFGDSTTATGNITTHAFNHSGIYNVCMYITVNNTCFADTCITITVSGNSNPLPCNLTANFNWQNSAQNSTAAANTVYFLNSSSGFVSGDLITWNFGDGSTSTLANPFHTYTGAGPYNVCLRVEHLLNLPGAPPCVSEVCHAVSVPQILVAYPNPTTNIVNVNLSLDSTSQVYAFIYNAQNVLVAQSIFPGFSGNNTITFNTSNLTAGYYSIRIYYNGQFSVARFVKL